MSNTSNQLDTGGNEEIEFLQLLEFVFFFYDGILFLLLLQIQMYCVFYNVIFPDLYNLGDLDVNWNKLHLKWHCESLITSKVKAKQTLHIRETQRLDDSRLENPMRRNTLT